jgi:hypothetical protein
MRVFGFDPRWDDGDRVCLKVFATIALWHVPHLNEEKKVKKFEQGLNSRIQIMMSYFDIWDFS